MRPASFVVHRTQYARPKAPNENRKKNKMKNIINNFSLPNHFIYLRLWALSGPQMLYEFPSNVGVRATLSLVTSPEKSTRTPYDCSRRNGLSNPKAQKIDSKLSIDVICSEPHKLKLMKFVCSKFINLLFITVVDCTVYTLTYSHTNTPIAIEI